MLPTVRVIADQRPQRRVHNKTEVLQFGMTSWQRIKTTLDVSDTAYLRTGLVSGREIDSAAYSNIIECSCHDLSCRH